MYNKLIDVIASYVYANPLVNVIIAILFSILIWALLGRLSVKITLINHIWTILNVVLAIIAVFIILYLTLFSRSVVACGISPIPFYSFVMAQIQPEIYRTMLMNVFLFVPVGLCFPYLLPSNCKIKYRVSITLLFGFSLSFIIEILQLVFKLGFAETDDVLCNTLGCLLGVLSYVLKELNFVRIKHKREKP